MALTLATAVRNAMCDAAVDSIDAGSGPGKLRIYSGTRPAGPGSSVGAAVLLAEFALSDPAFDAAGTAGAGIATLDVTPAVSDATADATGTATWGRFLDSDDNGKIDVSVGTSGADINLNTTSIVASAVVTITAGTITMPAS
jgi:hypothetical protein